MSKLIQSKVLQALALFAATSGLVHAGDAGDTSNQTTVNTFTHIDTKQMENALKNYIAQKEKN